MKILFLILAMAVFQPSTARADAVFDDAGSFQIAKAVKLGRDATVSGTMVKQGTAKTGGKSASTKGSSKNQGCLKTQFDNNGSCSACPSNAQCNGTSLWWCISDYWKNEGGKTCISCNTTTTRCPGKTEYKCKDQSGNISTTWSTTNRYKQYGQPAAPNMINSPCMDCGNTGSAKLYECNGTDRWCYGKKSRSGFYTDSARATSDTYNYDLVCEACNSGSEINGSQRMYECNGGRTKYCYGNKSTNGSSYDNKYAYATNSGGTTCQLCPTRALCNGRTGSSNYRCKSAYWRDTTKADPNKCVDCPANATCNGGETYTCLAAYWRNASEQCVNCPANATCDGSKNYVCKNGYWRDETQGDPYKCVNCPTNATCDGSTNYVCNNGYYKNPGNKTCDSIYDKTVCASGFGTKVKTNNNNTVYCVQPK